MSQDEAFLTPTGAFCNRRCHGTTNSRTSRTGQAQLRKNRTNGLLRRRSVASPLSPYTYNTHTLFQGKGYLSNTVHELSQPCSAPRLQSGTESSNKKSPSETRTSPSSPASLQTSVCLRPPTPSSS